ncbi:P-loop containing nucleoside triphosphate hydrolase protein [Meredithblackwellia eburnea MCA 4105]
MPPKKSSSSKKKKPVSNRGFATVSVPSKKELAAPVEEEDATTPAPGSLGSNSATCANGAEVGKEGDGTIGEAVNGESKDEWEDPEAAEKFELQGLAERIRPAAEKEIARVVKVIDYERRLAKGFSSYPWQEQDLIQRIIQLELKLNGDDSPLPLPDLPDEKVIAKVAVLFGTLEQLGFTKERTEECLRAIKNLELDDAIDWLFLHCDPSELGCEGPIQIIPEQLESISVPPTPRPEASSPPASHSPVRQRNASHPQLDEAAIEASLRARVLAYDDDESEDSQSKREEEKTANEKYASVKLQMSEIQRAQGASKRAQKAREKAGLGVDEAQAELMEKQIELLKKKLKAIEGDYTFRKVDAEKLYRDERTKLDAAQLSARLNGTSLDSPIGLTPPSSSTPASEEPNGLSPSVDIESSPVNGIDTPSTKKDAATPANGTDPAVPSSGASDAGSETGLFGALLDEMPTESTNDLGTSIPVRDMALPKHFSGKTPKLNLEETVRKTDKYATVSFRVITRGTRAVRAAVTIRWDGGRTQVFEMQEEACYDQVQAYNYIATVALFTVSQTSVEKQLPVAFRDLWEEMVKRKKEEEDEKYREALKVFKAIAEPRIQPTISRDPKSSKPTQISDEQANGHLPPPPITSEAALLIQQDLATRQQWPSYQEMLRVRATLPIAAYRSFIMSTIDSSQCIVLCGETGCGKSTQVPSFIVEHDMRRGKNVKVYCTEPRRISAISLAQRVSSELGEAPGACGTRNSLVGYSIRLDARVSPSSRIVYATTGIVLRMLEGRESLADCTHIIIDEVHERSIDSDFLLIILREILEQRKDLKVILMSATVDADKIAAYMGGCPVITVPGRTFPVASHFLEDVVELTHYRLDPNSDSPYVSRRNRNGKSRKGDQDDLPPEDDDDDSDILPANNSQLALSKQSRITLDCMDQNAINYDIIVSLLENVCLIRQDLVAFSSAILIFLPSLESIRRLSDILESHHAFGSNHFLVLPLHSTISNENQGLVFNIPKHGVRKIVLSTNMAETGVTIPDITCVIDTGKHREMRFDEKRQISRLVETFVAQSNAAQRRGRAGRVQEGICFHLFTKHRHDTAMAEHPQPEMLRLSLQDLALRIKIMKIGTSSIEEVLLKALDPPLAVNIQRSVSALIEAKALTATEEITPLGRHLAKLPMDVHLGKFLIMACLFGCLDAALTITAALNSKSPWLTPFGRESEADAVKRSFKVENSDFLTTYNAYCSWRQASSNGFERDFTRKNFLSQQNFQMIEELRQQYFSFLVDAGFIQATEAEKRELISTRYGKSRTRFVRVPLELDNYSRDPRAVMACLASAMYPKLLVVDQQSGQMRTLANNAPAAIHPSSVNFMRGRRIDFNGAKFIVFFNAMHTKKLYVWESGAVDERAVYLLCGNSDFQLPAHSLTIDRKIRTYLEPKTSIALKILRHRFNQIFSAKMKNPSVTTEAQQQWLELVIESLASKKEVEDKKKEADPVKSVTFSLQRNA